MSNASTNELARKPTSPDDLVRSLSTRHALLNDPPITYGHATHRGLKRSENQDSFGKFPREHIDLSRPKGQLFIVADGMGGHLGGREASQMAVHIIEEEYFSTPDTDIPASLLHAFDEANRQILARSHTDPSLHGMGTTGTALVLKDGQACIAHIGDSRAYRITAEAFEQLTQDHSQVEELVRRNILTPEQAARHPQRNVLSRALGVQDDIEVDLFNNIPLRVGDHFLLCSDGLAKVASETIQKTVLSHSPQEACDLLVQMANEHGGHDNVTVQVIRINNTEIPRPRPNKPRWWLVGLVVVFLIAAVLYFFV